MSFIPRRNLRLYERSVARRQELAAFLFLVTLWTLAINVFGNLAFTIFSDKFEWWAQRNRWEAAAVVAVSLLVLSYGALAALAWGIIGALNERRRFSIVLPVVMREEAAAIEPIEGYWITRAVQKVLAREDSGRVAQACRDALAKHPSRPFVGEFYEILASAVAAEMVHGVSQSCKFLLSKDAEFHGVDYSMLAEPPGPCEKYAVAGMPDVSMHLPARCSAKAGQRAPDQFGKRAPYLRIDTPYGEIEFSLRPQWAILSPGYNNLSLKYALARMGHQARELTQRSGKLPSLWMLEIPVEVTAHFRAGRAPVRFLRPGFEHFTAWVCETLDRTETLWSWEAFVDRGIEPNARAEETQENAATAD